MTKIIPFSGLSGTRGDATKQTDLDKMFQGGVISIGNFDGVHRGHRVLLSEVRRRADEINGPAVAVIFDPHPAAILRPGLTPPRLTWIERRAELLSQTGVDYLLVCETTQAFLNLSAEVFFQSLIVRQLQAKAVVEGPNFFFGKDRGGNVDLLGRLCRESGIDFAVAQPAVTRPADTQPADTRPADTQPSQDSGTMISSTQIRGLLSQGKIDQANAQLTTPYRFRGVVVRGAQRGNQIGFPTANLDQIDVVTPGPSVYAGLAWIDGKSYDAAIHIGPNPTFGDDALKVEVHVLDFSGDLYNTVLLVDVISHVREISRFKSTDDLIEQINHDIQTTRNRLARYRQTSANDDTGTQESKLP